MILPHGQPNGPETPSDTLRIPFGYPSDALRTGWLVPAYLRTTPVGVLRLSPAGFCVAGTWTLRPQQGTPVALLSGKPQRPKAIRTVEVEFVQG